MPNKRDWFNVGAIVPFLGVLFSSAFGLFAGPVMSLQVEILWIMGIVVIAFLVWFSASKTQQHARVDRERAREDRERLDKIIQLLAKPETTLDDVREATINISGPLSNTPLASVECCPSRNLQGMVEMTTPHERLRPYAEIL